jgi:hypothetical protein
MISSASTGSPAAGYWILYNSSGKPRKSCHVFGRTAVLTSSASSSQCAESTTIASGFGRLKRIRSSAGPTCPASMASIGEPCEINKPGKVFMMIPK